MWRTAKKIFIPENNLGLEASHMDTLVRRFAGVESYWETEKRVGVRMTNDLKREYQMFMVHSLYNRSLYFERDVFTTHRGKSVETIIGMYRAQTERFHWEVKPGSTAAADPRVAMTGKTSAQDENGQDDLLIAGVMSPYWGGKHKVDAARLGQGSPQGNANTRVEMAPLLPPLPAGAGKRGSEGAGPDVSSKKQRTS